MIERHFRTKVGHRAVSHNGVYYFSGFLADDLSKDMSGQTQEVCGKIDKLLADLGLSKASLISATIFLADFSKKDDMNSIWLGWLDSDLLPARTTVGVSDLGANVLIEVSVVAGAS